MGDAPLAFKGMTVFRDGVPVGVVKGVADGKVCVESFPAGPRPVNYYKPHELKERGLTLGAAEGEGS